MSFLSVLGKIGKAALPFIPGVGPIASTALNVAGSLAGGASAQRSQDRGAQAEYDLLRSQMENQRIGQANNQALDFANARRGAETDRLRQVGSADMLLGSKPPTDPRARMSGAGFMSPETLQMIRQRAMGALESGSDVPQLQQTQAAPTMPRGTGMDSFLNALSLGGTALGALNQAGLFNRQPQVDPRLNAANDERVNDIYGKVRFF